MYILLYNRVLGDVHFAPFESSLREVILLGITLPCRLASGTQVSRYTYTVYYCAYTTNSNNTELLLFRNRWNNNNKKNNHYCCLLYFAGIA